MSKLTRLYTLNMCYLLCFLHLSETEYILTMLSSQSKILVNYCDLYLIKGDSGFLIVIVIINSGLYMAIQLTSQSESLSKTLRDGLLITLFIEYLFS